MKALIAVGVLLNSACYLAVCFVAGLVTGNAWAWRLSIAAYGVTYLCYNAQMAVDKVGGMLWWRVSAALLVLSVVLGLAAGLAFL